jgi:hypothetical protein
MNPRLFLDITILPVLTAMGEDRIEDRAVLLLAIALQESDLVYRRQKHSGPARSFWQIEPPTACDCCERYEPSQLLRMDLFTTWPGIVPVDFYNSLEYNDNLACAVAAGLLYLCPMLLPILGQQEVSWHYYLKAWRPGKPRPYAWPHNYRRAMEAWTAPPFGYATPRGPVVASSTKPI